jgi:hypothetical protein
MAGNILYKEQSIVTLTTSGASLTTGSAGVANGTADLDCRVGGNAVDLFAAAFTLQAQCTTITGIAAKTIFADLYLVPLIDGTNLPDIDLTSGTSYLPGVTKVGTFEATKAMVSNTNMLFQSQAVSLLPLLYRPYILNRCGQTISVNWTLKVVAAGAQYT